MQDIKQWETSEKLWWDANYAAKPKSIAMQASLQHPRSFRNFYRAKLFLAVLPYLQSLPPHERVWIDIGAGDSGSVGALLPPVRYDYRYIATDISFAGLQRGRDFAHSLPVLHAASAVPFVSNSAAVVSGLGVLHHFPSWQTTLHGMIDLLRPGGYLLLHEVIDKPRIGGRADSLFAAIESPHEGQIGATELREIIGKSCEIVASWSSMTPLFVGLKYAINLDRLCRRSHRLTRIVVQLDTLWAKTIGQLHPTLSTYEVQLVAHKR